MAIFLANEQQYMRGESFVLIMKNASMQTWIKANIATRPTVLPFVN